MKLAWRVGYIALMVALLVVTTINNRNNAQLELENQLLQSRLRWIERTSRELKDGKAVISIYSGKDVDQLLEIYFGRSDVEEVGLEMTNVSDVGLKCIASMPNVSTIHFSGDLGVQDDSILILAQCKKLENLNLTCTKVTDEGISHLGLFPNLRTLTIEQGGQPILTSVAIECLAGLHQLRSIRLGDWAPDEAVQKLQVALPECVIEHRSLGKR